MTAQRFDWLDIHFTGLATVHDYAVEWKIVDIIDRGDVPTMWGTDMPMKPGDVDKTTSPETADPTATAWIKWDGCGSWDFPDQVHICGVQDARDFSRMVTQVYETTGQILPTWSEF